VIVTLELPKSTWPGAIVRLVYCVAVLVSYPLMLFPVTKVAVLVFGGNDDEWSGRLRNDVLRVALVSVLALIAIVEVHALDHIVALLGCLASTPLALVLPPLMHIKLVKQSRRSMFVNWATVVLGVIITVVTTVFTIRTWGSASS